MLPPECEAGSFPVVILRNVYTAAEAEAPGQEQDQFFADLEMDMLQEVRVCVWLLSSTIVVVVTHLYPYTHLLNT